MPIDMSPILMRHFEEARDKYNKAAQDGNAQAAAVQARTCANRLRLLGQNVPQQRQHYLELAQQWETTSKEIEEHGLGPGPGEGGQGGKGEQGGRRTTPFTESTEYIKSLIEESQTRWDNIAGLEDVKRLLLETIGLAVVEQGKARIQPYRGILLYGPPGTGKTMLAEAAAGSLEATFFNIVAGDVTSKYLGDSSHLIKTLYQVARENAPSIIFIDEIDALAVSRGETTHDEDRKILSEILRQMDGFKGADKDKFVLTLAATNRPGDLDSAVLRRFARQIYIRLPNEAEAAQMIRLHTAGFDSAGIDVNRYGMECRRLLFSGSDIRNLCTEALMAMLREFNPTLADDARNLAFGELQKKSLTYRPLAEPHFARAFSAITPKVKPEDLAALEKWNKGR